MTIRDSQRAIDPGSTESGDRKTLEAGLSEVLGGAGGAPGVGGPASTSSVSIPEDPVGALLDGSLTGDDLPVTDGLSVGPGAGTPGSQPASMLTPRAEKLRDLAQNASIPGVRQAARNELRRMVRQVV